MSGSEYTPAFELFRKAAIENGYPTNEIDEKLRKLVTPVDPDVIQKINEEKSRLDAAQKERDRARDQERTIKKLWEENLPSLMEQAAASVAIKPEGWGSW